MKHQQVQLASKRNFIRLMALAVMLVLMVCCTALWVSAANDEVTFDLTGAGFTYNADGGYWEKTYDGPTSNLAVAVTVNGEPVEVISATLNDYNASAVKADGTYELNYVTVVYEGGHTTKIPVVIKPIELSWNNRGSAEVNYDASGSYTGVAVNTANLELVGNRVAGETVTFDVSNIAFNFEGFGSTVATANVTLSSNNYVVNPLPVDVTVKPATITSINWSGLKDSFTYGDADVLNIKAVGNGNVPMTVYVKVGEKLVTLAEAYEKGLAVGEYQLTAVPVSNYYVLGQNVVNTTTVTVTKAVYTVVLGDGEFAYYGEQTNPGAGFGYQLVVSGKNGATLPGFVLSAINYEYTDAAGNVCTKVTKPGVYTVKVTADALENIEVVFENNTATLTVVNKYVAPVAPAPEAPVDQVETEPTFWGSPIGICLIVFLALVLLIIVPAYIGLLLLRIERSGRNPVISVETKGNVPAVEPVIIPDLIEDTDAAIDENLDNLAGEIAEELANSTEYDADATEAVADAMAQLDEELANMDLAALKAAELAEADAAASELADQLVLELMDQVAASDGTDVSEEVEKAVADAMAENFNESADATDAIALIEEEPVAEEVVEEAPAEEVVEETPVEEVPVELASEVEEVEETEEDEEESFGGFGSMPLDYIDAIAEAERYAEMLEQERRGEVQLVTRYRRSYLSRLAQSQGSIQDYYNAIKNLLLSYKGVKSRTSWNFESFNVGRTPLAKFNAKTRTLYVYIALSPEELVDTKYNFTDMSEKKKYAAVPVLLKVKGERKFKHALELITKLCEEKLQLPKKKNFVEVDYRMPFKTTEELVNEGIIKMMVAAIPVSAPASEEAVIEEAPVEETPVEEAVIEETPAEEEIVAEVPAEEAPAEEEIAAEVPAEETPAEEVNLDDVIANEAVAENAAEEEAPVEEEILAEVPAEETPAEEVNLDDVVAEGTNENA